MWRLLCKADALKEDIQCAISSLSVSAVSLHLSHHRLGLTESLLCQMFRLVELIFGHCWACPFEYPKFDLSVLVLELMLVAFIVQLLSFVDLAWWCCDWSCYVGFRVWLHPGCHFK